MKRFAVFASGHGGNLQAIIDATRKKKIKADLALVVCNKADAFALERAKKAGIANIFIDPKNFKTREAYDRKTLEFLKEHKIDFVVLAGYMRLVTPVFIHAYPNKILNIHPSLIPSFKGLHGTKDAFDYGVKVTGITVHFVTEGMDEGAIIAQDVVTITQKDTLDSLARKIHAKEHRLYPKVINLFAQGKLKIVGRKVVLQTPGGRL